MARQTETMQEQCGSQPCQRRPLQLGTSVTIQDQAAKAWSKLDTIVEVHRHRQYAVKIDISGSISLRNCCHLTEGSPPREPPDAERVPEQQVSAQVPPLMHRSRLRWLEDYAE